MTFAIFGATATHAETVNKILATVDGDPVTMFEVKQFLQQRSRGQQLPPGVDAGSREVLEAYITEKIIEKEISDTGIVVRDEDVDRYIEGVRQQNKLSPEQLRQAVEAQGMTWDSYRKKVREELQKSQLINREIRGKVNVTPEDIDRYYEAHKDEYGTAGELHVRHIVLLLSRDAPPAEVERVMTQARELRKEIEGGADFGEVAKQSSQDAAASSGGDLGWVKQGEMLEELETAAAKLKTGEVSPPVRTSVGVHLVKLEEKRDPSHTARDEMAGEIKERLYNAALEERYQRWLAEDLRKRHHVEIRP